MPAVDDPVPPTAAFARIARITAAPAFAGRRAGLAARLAALALIALAAPAAQADREHDERLVNAAALLRSFTADEGTSIPAELLDRAHGVAVIENVIRGGFLLGARRGRGVVSVRTDDGGWSNPALITLTGGSIGWQIGAESTDLVLVFANARSVRNMHSGKFTLGGDASAVAGPLGRNTTVALTGRAEVYAYVRSRGLYAGAAFEGARLDVDEQGNARFYGGETQALEPPGEATPAPARRFLRVLEDVARLPGPSARESAPAAGEEAIVFPLDDAD